MARRFGATFTGETIARTEPTTTIEQAYATPMRVVQRSRVIIPLQTIQTFATVVITATLDLPDGTEAAPSLRFTSDTDSGLRRVGANDWRLVSGAADVLQLTSAGITVHNGAVLLETNDGGALGVSGTAFSDLFLASGAVINFNAADVTLTHSLNTLTVAGGTFATAALTATTGSFSADITLTAAVSQIVPGATSLSLRNNADNADNLILTNAGAATFRSTVGGISTLTATTLVGALTGNADTATTLATARTIGGVSFDGSANIVPTTIAVTDTTDTTCFVALWEFATGDLLPQSDGALLYNAGTGELSATTYLGTIATATQNTVTTMTGLVTTGALNSGSITSGFGSINNGTSTFDTGVITTVGNLSLDGDLAFVGPQAITTSTGDLTLNPAGDVVISDNLTVSGTGPHAIGGAASNDIQLYLRGAYTSGGVFSGAASFQVETTLTGASGDTVQLIGTNLATSIVTQTVAETVTTIAQLRVAEPNITDNVTTITNAATVYIVAAPTEGSNNYALWVDDGAVQFDGTLDVTGAITGALTGNASTATTLATARTIGGVSFDGSANIVPTTIAVTDTADTTAFVALFESATGDLLPQTDGALLYNAGTGELTATTYIGTVATATQNSITTMTGLVTTGALNSGSITSGFGNIDNGSSTLGTGIITAVGDLSLDGDLDFVGPQSITTTTGDLTLNPAGNLVISATIAGVVNIIGTDGSSTGTGAATTETTLSTITLSANDMAANDAIRITAKCTTSGSAASKVARIRFGGAQIAILTNASGANDIMSFDVTGQNLNATNDQGWSGWSSRGATFVQQQNDSAIDTTANVDITLTGTTTDAADEVTHIMFVVELLKA